jgi:hypothetical protein
MFWRWTVRGGVPLVWFHRGLSRWFRWEKLWWALINNIHVCVPVGASARGLLKCIILLDTLWVPHHSMIQSSSWSHWSFLFCLSQFILVELVCLWTKESNSFPHLLVYQIITREVLWILIVFCCPNFLHAIYFRVASHIHHRRICAMISMYLLLVVIDFGCYISQKHLYNE